MFFDFNTNQELNISSQFFSGTDESKEGTIGVAFPLACHQDVNNTLNISSIIDHHNKDVLCKITKARTATADVENKIVNYSQTRCVTVEYNNSKNNFIDLLEYKNLSCYQSEQKITSMLQSKLQQFINAVTSNPKLRANFFIDKNKIEVKSYNYKQFSYDKDWNEIAELAQLDAEQSFGEVKEIFLNGFIDYISKQTKEKQNKIIDFALHQYYNTFNYGMMLSTNLWGKELNKLKKEKYKEYFKNELFKENLATEIIDLLEKI